MPRMFALLSASAAICAGLQAAPASGATTQVPDVVFWYGARQSVGQLGDAQPCFNVLGHVEGWRDLDTLAYRVTSRQPPADPLIHSTASTNTLSFREFRRLAADGDFNADIPLGILGPGENTVTITARLRDGREVSRAAVLVRANNPTPRLPFTIEWSRLRDVQDVGQAVDGLWVIENNRLRCRRPGYDRLFLIGGPEWRDCDVRTTVVVHAVESKLGRWSGGRPGLGLIPRFAGHGTGGYRHFPSGQPQWGYQPFGAIGWLRWRRAEPDAAPDIQFYRGDRDAMKDVARLAVAKETTYALRLQCETVPVAADQTPTTIYRFKVWPADASEPRAWAFEETQHSAHALRAGGVALLAHEVDASFGDIRVSPVTPTAASN